MAFMVGAVVVVTFELTLRQHEHEEAEAREKMDEERKKEIESDVFKHLLGSSIDRDVMDEVHIGIFSSRLVREELNVTYQFSSLETPSEPLADARNALPLLRPQNEDSLSAEE